MQTNSDVSLALKRFLASRRTLGKSRGYDVISSPINAASEFIDNAGSRLEKDSYKRTGKPDLRTNHWRKERKDSESDYALNNGLYTTTGNPSQKKQGNYMIGEEDSDSKKKKRKSRDSKVTVWKSPADKRQPDKFHVQPSSAWKPSLNVWRQNQKFLLGRAQMSGLPRDKTATSHKSLVKLSSMWRPPISAWWPKRKKSQLSQVRRVVVVPPRNQATTSDKSRGKSSSSWRWLLNVWWADHKSPDGLQDDRTTKSYVKLSPAWRPPLRAWRPAFSAVDHKSQSHSAASVLPRDRITSRGVDDVITSGVITRLADDSVMVAADDLIQPVVLVKSARRGMRAKYRIHKQPGLPQNTEKRLRNDEGRSERDESLINLFRSRPSRRYRRSVTGKQRAAAGLTTRSRTKTRKASSRQNRDFDDDDDYDEDDEFDRRDADDDDDDVSDEELQDLDAEMANAEEDADEEEEEEEEKKSNRDKKQDQIANKKRASENEVTVSKDLMKQLEDTIYNRVVAFVKGQPASGGSSPATGSTTPSTGSTTPGTSTTPKARKEEEEEEEEELIEEDLDL